MRTLLARFVRTFRIGFHSEVEWSENGVKIVLVRGSVRTQIRDDFLTSTSHSTSSPVHFEKWSGLLFTPFRRIKPVVLYVRTGTVFNPFKSSLILKWTECEQTP